MCDPNSSTPFPLLEYANQLHLTILDPISGSAFYLAVTALSPTPPGSACGVTGRLAATHLVNLAVHNLKTPPTLYSHVQWL